MKKSTYTILFILSVVFIVYVLFYVNKNEITKEDLMEYVPEDISISKLTNKINISDIGSKNNSADIKETNVFTSANETLIRKNFMSFLQEKRKNEGKGKVSYSSSLERKAQWCAENMDQECIIESYQNGVGWQIPWYTDVIGCGNAFGNRNNPSCLLESLEEDTDFQTDIYEDLMNRNRIGVGVYYVANRNEVSYWIIVQ